MEKTTGMEEIESGIKLMKTVVKGIKNPADANSKKEITNSIKLLEKKLKLMKKNEQLRVQYLDRTAFDTVQGVFQTLHLYIISTDELDDVYECVDWLRRNETAYEIADRMQKAAIARADFAGAKGVK